MLTHILSNIPILDTGRPWHCSSDTDGESAAEVQRRHAQHLKSVRTRQQKAQCQRDELHAFRSCAVRQQSHQHALHMHVTTLNLHLNVLRSCADRISTGGTQMATAALKLTMSALHLRSCQALMFAQMTSLSGKPMKPGMASRGGTPAAIVYKQLLLA